MVIVLIGLGCARGDGSNDNGSGAGRPRIVSTTPADNAANVLVESSIEVVFSEAMSQASVTDAFSLQTTTGQAINGTAVFIEDTLVFTPSGPLGYLTAYLAAVGQSAKDLGGQTLGASYVWSFTTQPVEDVVNPNIRVTDYLPAAAHNALNFSSGQCSIGLSSPASTQPAIYATWYDFRNDAGTGDSDIFFAGSTNGGVSFSANIRVNDDTGIRAKKYPCMSVDQNGVIYIVWDDERNGNSDIYFTKSTDGGLTWRPNVKVSDDTGSAVQSAPTIAVSGGATPTIYVAWRDERTGLSEIYFAKSTNGGQSFNANVKVNDTPPVPMDSNPPLGHAHPSIGVTPAGTIVVVWKDNRNTIDPDLDPDIDPNPSGPNPVEDNQADTYFSRSTDGGVTFGPNIRLNDDNTHREQHDPTLRVAPNGDILVAWVDLRDANADIYFTRSTDNGISFCANPPDNCNIRVNDFGQSGEDIPTVAVNSEGTIVIGWQDNRNAVGSNGELDVYMARSYLLDGVLTFGVSQRVNDDPTFLARQLDINAVLDDQGNAYMIWADKRNSADPLAEESPGDIYFTKVSPAP
jgi:hypothetical protein